MKVNQPSNLLDRITRLERELAEVRKRVGLSSATISGGDLTVQEGGTIRLKHPNGTIVAQVGNLGQINGEDVWGVQFKRPDGSEAMFVYGTESGAATFVGMRDRAGNIVVSDDGVTGEGLATPYIPIPFGQRGDPSSSTPWRTSSSTWTNLSEGWFIRQNPRATVKIIRACSAPAAEVQLINGFTGDVLAGPVSFGNSWDYTTLGPITVPGAYQDEVDLMVQARVTSGSGTVGLAVVGAWGHQS